jgi:hypothetical protein
MGKKIMTSKRVKQATSSIGKKTKAIDIDMLHL